MKKEFKINDKVIYSLNGKWVSSNNVVNFKVAEITIIEEVLNTKIYTLEFKNKFGQLINTLQTYNINEIKLANI